MVQQDVSKFEGEVKQTSRRIVIESEDEPLVLKPANGRHNVEVGQEVTARRISDMNHWGIAGTLYEEAELSPA